MTRHLLSFLLCISLFSLSAQTLHPDEVKGDSLSGAPDSQSAVATYMSALGAYEKAGQWERYVAIKRKIAMHYYGKDEYEKALEFIDQAISDARMRQTPADTWWELYHEKVKITAPLKLYDALTASADSVIAYLPAQHLQKYEISTSVLEMAAGASLAGFDSQKGRGYARRALTAYQLAGKDSIQYARKTYQMLGYAAVTLGDFAEALHWQQKIDQYILALDLGKADFKAMILLANTAGFYSNFEDWEKAADYNNLALQLDQKIFSAKPSPYRLTLLYNLANAYDNIEPSLVKGVYQKITELVQQKDYAQFADPRLAISAYIGMAAEYAQVKEYKQATQAFEKATELALLQQDSSIMEIYYDRAANYYISMKQYDRAKEINEKNIATRKKQVDKRYAESHVLQGNIYHRLCQYDSAIVYYKKAFSFYKTPNNNAASTGYSVMGEYIMRAYFGYSQSLHRIALRSSNYKERLIYLQQSVESARWFIEELHNIKKNYYKGAIQTYRPMFEDSQEPYVEAIGLMLDMYRETKDKKYIEEAFQYVEESKSLLLENALLSAEAKAFGNLPDSLLQKEKNLIRQLVVLEKRVAEAEAQKDEAQMAILRDEALFKVKRQYEQLLLTFETKFPAYYQLRYDTTRFTVRQIRDKMPPGTLLLSYVANPDSNTLYIFSLGRDQDIQVVEARLDSNVAEQITQFRGLLQSVFLSQKAHRKQFIQLGHQLYKQYLLPVADQIDKAQHLVIVGEGLMQALPFEALLSSAQDLPLTDLPYLVRKKRVSYQYAAKFIGATQPIENAGNTKNVLAFAPVFNEQSVEAQYADNVRGHLTGFGEFNPLPYSEHEARTLRRLYPSASSRTLLRKDANESALKEALRKSWKIVHLASHSFIDTDNPKFSGIACYPDSTSEDDGILYVNEIYPLTVNTDLITLSSCESGMGKVTTREGIMGINRAFLYTGVRNIVFSLWKANDRATSLLMQRFYEGVAAGKGYAEALQSAKLSLLANPNTATPNFWANFQLIGW